MPIVIIIIIIIIIIIKQYLKAQCELAFLKALNSKMKSITRKQKLTYSPITAQIK